ncbi:hypothetical protein JQM83_06370 [Parabacteroides distasonis]|nr:hypothetical protein [Parabacteroides distasonis]
MFESSSNCSLHEKEKVAEFLIIKGITMELTEKQKSEVRERLKKLMSQYDSTKLIIDNELHSYQEKVDRLPEFVESADNEFEKLTSITKKDLSFLLFASTLQVARQWITSNLKTRLSDKESAQSTPFHSAEHSDRSARQYYATKTEIVNNPVPFDAVRKAEVVKNNGNPKLNGFNHRYRAIGHDPILGLVFGTANIMTKTITVAKGNFLFETYHVGSGIATNGKNDYKIDMLTNQASTSLMFDHLCSRLKREGQDAWETLAIAFAKQLVHLLSDVRTAKSLPLPVVSAVSPDISRVLNLCGIDSLSIGTFATDFLVSKMIDIAIAYMHIWCYNPKTDGSIEVYQVRTKNIIYYSNLISLASATVQTLFRAYMGDTLAISKFDFGGTISAWQVIWKTPLIVSDMKSEYIRSLTANYLGK